MRMYQRKCPACGEQLFFTEVACELTCQKCHTRLTVECVPSLVVFGVQQ